MKKLKLWKTAKKRVSMEWWYKSKKYGVSKENINLLNDFLNKELLKIGSMQIANLYEDQKFFYIRTSNNIALHTFLFIHGFEEVYDVENVNEDELNLFY